MIDGVIISPLREICDERGSVLHMLRNDHAEFKKFGEFYFSTIYPKKIKAWHIHKAMTINYAVPHGRILFVLHDERPNSPTKGVTQEILMGERNYFLVTVPPMIWNGFKGIGDYPAIVANCSSIPHDPKEIKRRDPFDETIGYDWSTSII